MSSGAFSTGWHVVRTRRSEFLDAGRLRRRTVLAGVVATVAGALLVVADLVWGIVSGPWPAHVVALVCFAAALGCLVATFVPVGAPGTASVADAPRGDWRREDRIGRQFAARPPAMLLADRDDVLARAERTIGPSTVAAARFVWLPVTWVVAWVGLLVAGLATSDEITLWLMPPVFALLQSATFIAAVTGAGRAEQARRRALALPPTPPADPLPRRNQDPLGSKLRLPDD